MHLVYSILTRATGEQLDFVGPVSPLTQNVHPRASNCNAYLMHLLPHVLLRVLSNSILMVQETVWQCDR